MLKKAIVILLLPALTACSMISTGPNRSAATSQPPKTASGANVELGMNYLQQGDVQRSKQKLLQALQQEPDSSQAHEAMGYFLETTGDKKAAESNYVKAVELNPKSGRAQNNYGTFLCRMGRYQEAEQHFLLAVQDTTYLNTAQAYENAGLCAMQIPDDTKAAAYFAKAIQQDPRLSMSFLELAQLSYRQSDYQQAQQYLNQYFQLVTEPSAEALFLGVQLARQMDDTNAAGRYTLMLQSRYPNSAEYRQLMATPLKAKPKAKKPLYF